MELSLKYPLILKVSNPVAIIRERPNVPQRRHQTQTNWVFAELRSSDPTNSTQTGISGALVHDRFHGKTSTDWKCCLFLCVFVGVYMCVYICLCVYLCLFVSIFVFASMCVFIPVSLPFSRSIFCSICLGGGTESRVPRHGTRPVPTSSWIGPSLDQRRISPIKV